MADVTSKVTIKQAFFKKLDAKVKEALSQTAEKIHGEILDAHVMPKETGKMEDTSTFVDESNIEEGNVKIVTSTPYARRLYYHPEYHFNKEYNPNARGRWLEPWLEGGENHEDIDRAFGMLIRKGME